MNGLIVSEFACFLMHLQGYSQDAHMQPINAILPGSMFTREGRLENSVKRPTMVRVHHPSTVSWEMLHIPMPLTFPVTNSAFELLMLHSVLGNGIHMVKQDLTLQASMPARIQSWDVLKSNVGL